MKYLFYLFLFVGLFSCSNSTENAEMGSGQENKDEILIYCENAMVPVLTELKGVFEEKYNCKITLRNDCSQNLVSLIKYSHKGDLYIPGSIHGFDQFGENKSIFLVDSVFIGYNSLVILSAKGNPSNYSGLVKSLKNDKHALIIANPATSSLGAETKKMLLENKIYKDVVGNVIALTTDSRGLIKSIENNEAQLIIDWQSDLFYNNNSAHVDVFKMKEDIFLPTEIYGGILSTSENKKLAKEFLDYVSGESGLLVLKKYGFLKRKALIF